MIVEIDDTRHPSEAKGAWYLNELGCGLTSTMINDLNEDGRHYCLLYLLRSNPPLRTQVIGPDISAHVERVASGFDLARVAPAPEWLEELLISTQVEADTLTPEIVRDLFIRFFVEELIRRPGRQSKLYKQGRSYYFNAKEFAASIGVYGTQEQSKLYELMTAIGIELRRSMTTTTSSGRRIVAKMARISSRNASARQLCTDLREKVSSARFPISEGEETTR